MKVRVGYKQMKYNSWFVSGTISALALSGCVSQTAFQSSQTEAQTEGTVGRGGSIIIGENPSPIESFIPLPIVSSTPVVVVSPTPVVSASPTVTLAPPNSDICVLHPEAEACKRAPAVTTPGVVSVLFTMSQIPQASATLILVNAIKYASPAKNPKILFVKDSNTAGEDEGDPDYIRNTLLSGYDVEYGIVPTGGLDIAATAGKDLVIVSNPGHPLSDAKTLATLKAFAGGVILLGDDMDQGAGFSMSAFTGLAFQNNGVTMSCNGRSYNYDNEAGYKYGISMNTEFLPGLSDDQKHYEYGNDLDITVAQPGVQVLAWGSAAANTCDIGQVPAVARRPK